MLSCWSSKFYKGKCFLIFMEISRRDFIRGGLAAIAGVASDLTVGSYLNVAEAASYLKSPRVELKGKDFKALANIMYAEAANQGSTTRLCIAEVIKNRVEDSRYPDSIEGVVMKGKEFTPIWKKSKLWRQAIGELSMNEVDEMAYNECVCDAKNFLSGFGISLPAHKIIAFHDKTIDYEDLSKKSSYWKGLDFSFFSDDFSFYKDGAQA